MTPSTVLTPTTPQGRPSSLDTGAAVSRLSQRLRLRQHPPELFPADAVSTPARPLQRPNRVHLRLGPVFCLGILSTPHRGFPRHDAVSLSYPPLTCHRRTQTCTGWFHGFISVRSTGVPPGVPPVPAGVPPGGPRRVGTHHCVIAMRRVGDSAGRRAEQAGRLCYPSWINAPFQCVALAAAFALLFAERLVVVALTHDSRP